VPRRRLVKPVANRSDLELPLKGKRPWASLPMGSLLWAWYLLRKEEAQEPLFLC
jgi:hypothetical protein